jgi:nucleotide-binding universal stress UspA family protein
VHQSHIDLAIVSTHGRTGLKHLLLGSVAEELFRNLPCPVLTIGPKMARQFGATSEIKEILFPTDLSYESGAVFPHLAAVAAEYKSHMTLLHVVPRSHGRNSTDGEQSESLRQAMHRMFCAQIDPRCEGKLIVEAGDPVERILAHARADNVDLIGFGTRKAGEISTHFRNTVPYRVLLEAECPVLTAHFAESW